MEKVVLWLVQIARDFIEDCCTVQVPHVKMFYLYKYKAGIENEQAYLVVVTTRKHILRYIKQKRVKLCC